METSAKRIKAFAIIIKPKEPLVNWAKNIAEQEKIPKLTEIIKEDAGVLMEATVLLIQWQDNPEQVKKYLTKHSATLFEQQLGMWCNDQKLWPADRSEENFYTWFDVTVHTEIMSFIS